MRSVGLVFDVDGVLVDTSRSFPEVVAKAVNFCARFTSALESVPLFFSGEHYIRAKAHPMFNDDYDIAWTFLSWAASNTALVSREGWTDPKEWESAIAECRVDPLLWTTQAFGSVVDRTEVREVCENLYFGEESPVSAREKHSGHFPASGLWKNERPCIGAGWGSLGKPAGIYTGRNRRELLLALRLLEWEDFPGEHCITVDDEIKKPSPEGLFRLEKILGVSEIFFFGDSESDRKAFEEYGKGQFFPVGEVFGTAIKTYGNIEEALAAAGVKIQ